MNSMKRRNYNFRTSLTFHFQEHNILLETLLNINSSYPTLEMSLSENRLTAAGSLLEMFSDRTTSAIFYELCMFMTFP